MLRKDLRRDEFSAIKMYEGIELYYNVTVKTKNLFSFWRLPSYLGLYSAERVVALVIIVNLISNGLFRRCSAASILWVEGCFG